MDDEPGTLAGIQYSGLPGVSKECVRAVLRLIQFGDHISRARILSCANRHSFLLTINAGDLIAVKSGFGSGYAGEGAYALSYVLDLLDAYSVEIEEYDVADEVLERLDRSGLTWGDLQAIDDSQSLSPARWYDYQLPSSGGQIGGNSLWSRFPMVVPFAILDPRLEDLAKSFSSQPDQALLVGYRRLEDLVRGRTGLEDSGQKLFSQAFLGSTPRLTWDVIDGAETGGRGTLFTATFLAHRNPRAHREGQRDSHWQALEFLLLNHLYRLEADAHLVPDSQGNRLGESPRSGK
ncbi:MAG: TIGR02391 family protein [Gemmatimonadales bacterium]